MPRLSYTLFLEFGHDSSRDQTIVLGVPVNSSVCYFCLLSLDKYAEILIELERLSMILDTVKVATFSGLLYGSGKA
jgi:hypothetical protein